MNTENTSVDTDIVLNLEGTVKIECTKTRTGEKNVLTVNTAKLQMSLSTIYKIPIINSRLSLTESNCLSPIGKINEKINILNVENGFVILTPIVHGTFVENGENIGKLI
jgi:hypothetical protein